MSKWISVKDALPPNGVAVLTYPGWAARESGVSLDQWCEGMGCFLMWVEDTGGPTHWMHLPPPPAQEPPA